MPLLLTLNPLGGAGARETRTLTEGRLTLGRGPGNDWVLADPDRQLSKTHCIIAAEGSRYALTDVSANGVYINGSRHPTKRDSRVLLADGDRFRIGDFEVTVTDVDIAPAAAASQGRRSDADPFAAGRGNDPFAAGRPVDPFAGGRPADPFAGGADDPFAEPGTVFKLPHATPMPAQRGLDAFDRADEARGRTADADDDLFRGLSPAVNWEGPSQADNADAPKQAFLQPRPLPSVNPQDIDFDALLGDEPIGGGAFPAYTPSASGGSPSPLAGPPETRAPTPRAPSADVGSPDQTLPPQRIDPPAAPTPSAAAPRSASSADPAALLAAFLEGAGVPDLKAGSANPEAALRDAGAVFRAMVEGLREVLMSRAAIKNELRLDQTMLRSRDNNALKFSVTPEEAVAALLIQKRTGYKPPLDAVREAFRDIQGHEMAVMAGVQTALTGLLRRFDPVALEARLHPGRLDSIMPAARKARIWELFCATYKDIASEAEDDFQSVFGREFARAYDAQMRNTTGVKS